MEDGWNTKSLSDGRVGGPPMHDGRVGRSPSVVSMECGCAKSIAGRLGRIPSILHDGRIDGSPNGSLMAGVGHQGSCLWYEVGPQHVMSMLIGEQDTNSDGRRIGSILYDGPCSVGGSSSVRWLGSC